MSADEARTRIGTFILVGAGKGGVGKSTVAVNLAIGLTRLGAKVGLLDADAHGPSIPMMLGVSGQRPGSDGALIEPVEAHGLRCMSIGLLVEPGQAMIWRGPMLARALMQLLEEVSWGELDYMVVDLPPGTGDIPLTVAQKVEGAVTVLVTTPQEVAIADVRRVRAMLEKVEIPVLGLIENMSCLVCPNCAEKIDVFDRGGGERAAMEMGIPFLGAVPLHPMVREGGDRGVPVLVSDPHGPEGSSFVEIARKVVKEVAGRTRPPSAPPGGRPTLPVVR